MRGLVFVCLKEVYGGFNLFFKPSPFSVLPLFFWEFQHFVCLLEKSHTNIQISLFPFLSYQMPWMCGINWNHAKETMINFTGRTKNSFLRLFTLHVAEAVFIQQ